MIDPLARIVAIAGLALSAVKIVYDLWRDRRRAKVIVDQAKIRGSSTMSVSIVNTGHRPTTINGLGVFFDNGRILGTGHVRDDEGIAKVVTYDSDVYSTELPMRIDDGEPANIYYPLDTLDSVYAEGGRIISIVAWDAEGREYKGKMPRYLKKRLEERPDQNSEEANRGDGLSG